MAHTTVSQSYLVATLPRSASWLLSSMLDATGRAGHPGECFHWDLLAHAPECGAREHVRNAAGRCTTDNGIFGAKVHWSQFAAVAGLFDAGDPGALLRILREELPRLRFVWLTRRDKLRQAISYYRAIHTGVWWCFDDDVSRSEPPPPQFDIDTIDRLERQLVRHETRWQAFFEHFDIEPFLVLSEDLAAHPREVVLEIARALELPIDTQSIGMPALRRQSDELSDEWHARCLQIRQGRLQHACLAPSAPDRPRADEPVNRREFRIAAVQRSGHHGIINWLTAQCEKPLLYLNDVRPRSNPFSTASLVLETTGSDKGRQLPLAEVDRFRQRTTLVHSYEDRALAEVFGDDFELHHDEWVGASCDRHDIIVVRDPFNTFASRMRASWMRHSLHRDSERDTVVGLWKQHAREALGQTHTLRHRPVAILFNRWIRDEDYRRDLAARLKLSFSDAGLRTVSPEFGASSFEGMRFNGRADEMPLLDRWQPFADDPTFRALFIDPELFELSEALFGRMPGTQRLRPARARSARGRPRVGSDAEPTLQILHSMPSAVAADRVAASEEVRDVPRD